MDSKQFFEQVREVLETDDPIDSSTVLIDLEEFDSLGMLNLMTMFEEMGVETSPQTFEDVETGSDLLRIAGAKVDG